MKCLEHGDKGAVQDVKDTDHNKNTIFKMKYNVYKALSAMAHRPKSSKITHTSRLPHSPDRIDSHPFSREIITFSCWPVAAMNC